VCLFWRRFALSGWQAFKACLRREWTLMTRHRFIYIFRTCQVNRAPFMPSPQQQSLCSLPSVSQQNPDKCLCKVPVSASPSSLAGCPERSCEMQQRPFIHQAPVSCGNGTVLCALWPQPGSTSVAQEVHGVECAL
jgi:hypothetical protein